MRLIDILEEWHKPTKEEREQFKNESTMPQVEIDISVDQVRKKIHISNLGEDRAKNILNTIQNYFEPSGFINFVTYKIRTNGLHFRPVLPHLLILAEAMGKDLNPDKIIYS